MKVKRIIAIIEVEDNNSTTSVEVTKLFLDNIHSPIVVTDIKSNGNSTDITKVYNAVDDCRASAVFHLKGIVNSINDALTRDYVCGESPTE